LGGSLLLYAERTIERQLKKKNGSWWTGRKDKKGEGEARIVSVKHTTPKDTPGEKFDERKRELRNGDGMD